MSCQARAATSFQVVRGNDVVCTTRKRVPLRVHPQRQEWLISDYKDKEKVILQLERTLGKDDEQAEFLLQRAALIADEMLENALVAAPRDADGRQLYAKGSMPTAKPGEQVTFCFFFDGENLALEVTDTWGALSSEKVCEFIRKNLAEAYPVEDRAGRGLYFMWQFMEDFYISVTPGVETSVGGVLKLHQTLSGQGADNYGSNTNIQN